MDLAANFIRGGEPQALHELLACLHGGPEFLVVALSQAVEGFPMDAWFAEDWAKVRWDPARRLWVLP